MMAHSLTVIQKSVRLLVQVSPVWIKLPFVPKLWLRTYRRAQRREKRRLHRRYFITSKNDWSTSHRLFWSRLKQKHSSSSMNGSIPNSICRVAFIQQRLLPGGFGNLQVTISWSGTILMLLYGQYTQKQPNKPSIKLWTIQALSTISPQLTVRSSELCRSIDTWIHKNWFHLNSWGNVTSTVNSNKCIQFFVQTH